MSDSRSSLDSSGDNASRENVESTEVASSSTIMSRENSGRGQTGGVTSGAGTATSTSSTTSPTSNAAAANRHSSRVSSATSSSSMSARQATTAAGSRQQQYQGASFRSTSGGSWSAEPPRHHHHHHHHHHSHHGASSYLPTSVGQGTWNNLQATARKREMVYQKIDDLLQAMVQPQSGLPVRVHKQVLTSIPAAFTGDELLKWMYEHVVNDPLEAAHFANLLVHMGYIFPVSDTGSLRWPAFKDGTALYRLQAAYFWPCKVPSVDNTDYAIYLLKRSLKAKGVGSGNKCLDAHEMETLLRLKKLLGTRWEFIQEQAEAQHKLDSKKKKAEKVVLDSQERAFWRVHQPAPGHVNYLESRPVSYTMTSQPVASSRGSAAGGAGGAGSGGHARRESLTQLQKDVAFLTGRLLKQNVKTSAIAQSLIGRTQYLIDTDPLVGEALKSTDAWVTDDAALFGANNTSGVFATTASDAGDSVLDLNMLLSLSSSPATSVSLERRLKSWELSIQDLMRDPLGMREFELFLEKEYSHENLRFWRKCQQHKFGSLRGVENRVQEIYDEFLAPNALCQVNVDWHTVSKVEQALRDGPSLYTLDQAQHHIHDLMKRDSYQRFLRSEHFQSLRQRASQSSSKKTLLSAVSGQLQSLSPFGRISAVRKGSAASGSTASAGGGGGGFSGGGDAAAYSLAITSTSTSTSPAPMYTGGTSGNLLQSYGSTPALTAGPYHTSHGSMGSSPVPNNVTDATSSQSTLSKLSAAPPTVSPSTTSLGVLASNNSTAPAGGNNLRSSSASQNAMTAALQRGDQPFTITFLGPKQADSSSSSQGLPPSVTRTSPSSPSSMVMPSSARTGAHSPRQHRRSHADVSPSRPISSSGASNNTNNNSGRAGTTAEADKLRKYNSFDRI